MEEKIEQELRSQIKQLLRIELEVDGKILRSRYHPERCKKVAKKCEEMLSRYPIPSLPPDIYSTLRRYYLANKLKVTLHNIIDSLVRSPECFDALDKYLTITNKCGEKIERLEVKLKGFVSPSYRCINNIDEDLFEK